MLKKYKNRKSKRKVATVAGVKRIINNTMQSRQSSNMQIVQNTGGDYYFLATLSPDIEETGQSSIRSIDVGLSVIGDCYYRVIVWQQLSAENRNVTSSNYAVARTQYLNKVIDLDNTRTQSEDTARLDIITPWDAFNSGGTVKVLYDKIILQDANGNGSPIPKRFHIGASKLKNLKAPHTGGSGLIVGAVYMAVITSIADAKLYLQRRCQYNI